MKKLILVSFVIALSSAAFAGHGLIPGNNNGGKIEKCLQMASNLDLLREVNRRMELNQQPSPAPAPSSGFSCMLVDAGYSKTFLGKGTSRLAAEAEVRQNCGKVVNSSYCNGAIKCAQPEHNSTGAFCLMTDAGYGKTFSGEGTDIVEAEANAKIKCQSSVNSSYCGNVSAKCEVTH